MPRVQRSWWSLQWNSVVSVKKIEGEGGSPILSNTWGDGVADSRTTEGLDPRSAIQSVVPSFDP